MSSHPPNFFKAFLAQDLKAGIAASEIFLDRLTNLIGETIETADFADFNRGILTVNPQGDGLTSFPENISFTTVDDADVSLTGAIRGLDKSGVSQTDLMRFYPTGTPVIISFGNQNIADLLAYIAGVVAGSIGTATNTTAGATKLTRNMGTLARALSPLVSQQSVAGLTLQVAPFGVSDYVYAGGNSPSFVAPSVNPRIDLLAYDKVLSSVIIKQGTEAASPAVPQMSGDYIALAYVYNRVGETSIKDTDDSTNGYIYLWPQQLLTQKAGDLKHSGSTQVETGYLATDGSSFSVHTYPELARALIGHFGYGTGVTATANASTDIITATAHGFVNGDPVFFGTTNTLPAGLSPNTTYYVISATTNTFQVSTTKGGSAVNITDTGTGTHTAYGNMLTPNTKNSALIGAGQRVSTATIASVTGNVITATGPVNNQNNHWQTGQAVVFTASTAGNLVNATTYYIVAVTPTTFSLATSLANAQNNTVITLLGTETGSFALTMTSRAIGETGGEENHAMSASELLSHHHSGWDTAAGSNQNGTAGGGRASITGNTGANAAMNNMQPFLVTTVLVKI